MPPKTHRQTSGTLARHSRSTSGGSSKIGLNLHFTQKDPPMAKIQDKHRKNGHVDPKTMMPFPRVNSAIQADSKEHTNQKRPHAPNPKHSDSKQKTGFTISSPGEDEDGWVSSETGSGAASPDDSSDEEEPSRERSKTPVKEAKFAPALEKDGLASTPRAESSMSRVPTARPTAPSEAPLAPANYFPTDISNRHSKVQLTHQRHHTEPNAMESRSVTTSPTHHHDSSKRHSMTRPPSVHSTRSEAPLRPHPLIRGNSYGQGMVLGSTTKPAPLAPLTVTSGSSAAQMSSSPTNSSISPTSIQTNVIPHSPNRRTSISSARSVVTLPMTPISPQPPSKQHPDRNRTVSNMSTSSTSFAALASLAHLPVATSRPSTPQYTSHFPPLNPHANLDMIYPLLPPPYLGAHLTVLATKSPVRESFNRVVRAKQGIC